MRCGVHLDSCSSVVRRVNVCLDASGLRCKCGQLLVRVLSKKSKEVHIQTQSQPSSQATAKYTPTHLQQVPLRRHFVAFSVHHTHHLCSVRDARLAQLLCIHLVRRRRLHKRVSPTLPRPWPPLHVRPCSNSRDQTPRLQAPRSTGWPRCSACAFLQIVILHAVRVQLRVVGALRSVLAPLKGVLSKLNALGAGRAALPLCLQRMASRRVRRKLRNSLRVPCPRAAVWRACVRPTVPVRVGVHRMHWGSVLGGSSAAAAGARTCDVLACFVQHAFQPGRWATPACTLS